MFGAGPLRHPDGSRADLGLIVIRAASAEEARRIADSDPMHQAGARTYTLYEWTLNEGRLTISVTSPISAAAWRRQVRRTLKTAAECTKAKRPRHDGRGALCRPPMSRPQG